RRSRSMRVAALALVTTVAAAALAQDAPPPYKDPKRPIDERVKDLLGRMTLEEKVDQLKGGRPIEQGAIDPSGRFTDANLEEALKERRRNEHRLRTQDLAVLNNAL